jgi:hypothetical protein
MSRCAPTRKAALSPAATFSLLPRRFPPTMNRATPKNQVPAFPGTFQVPKFEISSENQKAERPWSALLGSGLGEL